MYSSAPSWYWNQYYNCQRPAHLTRVQKIQKTLLHPLYNFPYKLQQRIEDTQHLFTQECGLVVNEVDEYHEVSGLVPDRDKKY